MQQLGNYTVDEKPIGSGGMGCVLRGRDGQGRVVAIKQILPQYVSDIQYRERIEREIQFLRSFNHPNVVKVYDHFELNGSLNIVMELVEGQNIEEYVTANGPIPWQDALGYMEKLVNTMAYVHSKDIIHRDIKPGNVMRRHDGNVCLLDFGVAKSNSTSLRGGGTIVGTIIGTDGYMSPEQAQGMTIDTRADIYSLGCVLYYMLTGHHAYDKLPSDQETMYAILTRPFPKLSKYVKGIPPVVQQLIDKATDRNMLTRFQTCADFSNEISRILNRGTEVNPGVQNLSITVGRENCDIIVSENSFRVSRHHATITRKEFTGGVYYVYTDCSSNGTLINNMVYTKGMSYNIQRGTYPEILLAGEPGCRLDIGEVERLLESMAEESKRKIGPVPPDGNGKDITIRTPEPPISPVRPLPDGGYTNADNIMDAVKQCFTNMVNFNGRCGRGEYWWWVLFNFIINTVIMAIYIAADFKPEVLVASSLWGLVTFLPSLSVSIRRLHDVGKSWGFLILCSVFSFTIAPYVLLIVNLAKQGEPLTNAYGPGYAQVRRH
ncbi:MAG: protein kinase [Muribaculaceae bacterium]|nr:protein kinase [Muribaculaceae bacterium]